MTEIIHAHGVAITVRRHVGPGAILPMLGMGQKAIRTLEGDGGIISRGPGAHANMEKTGGQKH